MKTHTKILIFICIVLSFVNLAWLGFNSYMYLDMPKLIVRTDMYANLATYGLIVFFFSHLIIILSTILSLKNSKSMSIAGIILLVLGVISFIFLLFHFVSLNEIWDDYKYGYSFKSMLKLTWHSQIVMICFFLFSLFYFITLSRVGDKYASTKSVSREQIFVALNIIGIVCSILGILLVLFYSRAYHIVQLGIGYKIIPFCFVLLPYLLVLAGWGIRYFRDRRSGWYDEKQNSNINRSGMVAMLTSLVLTIGLTIFYFHKTPVVFKQIDIAGVIMVLLLPFYFFLVLFVLYVTALYNFKNN
jgi:hypothetical protein